MKYLLTVLTLCLLLFSIEVNAQADKFRKGEREYSGTFDATDADTISIANPEVTGDKTYTLVVWLDSLDGSSDSTLIQYRRAWRNAGTGGSDTLFLGASWKTGDGAGTAAGDTITGAALWDYCAYAIDAGSAQSWSTLKVHGGADGSLDDFDNDFDWRHGRRYECEFDFNGYNWRYLQLKLTKTADDSTVGTADSCKWNAELDID